MKKMVLIVILFFLLPLKVSAQENTDPAGEVYAASGAGSLDGGSVLEDWGISFDDPKSILSVTPKKLWDIIKNTVCEKVSAPLRLLTALCAVVILTAAADTLGDTVKKGGTSKVYEMICVLSGVAVSSGSVCAVLEETASALSEGAEFMTCFVPVFAGIAAAGGNITSAAGYNVLVLGAADAAIQTADRIFMPMLGMCMCLAIVDASCRTISLGGMLEGVKKTVTWGLGLIMTIFTGLLSIQSIVGTSADSLAGKTAKYLISNCVPVVGGAVSDAYSTVRGSIVLLRNGVGGVGIAALAVILVPPLVSLALYRLCVSAACAAAEVFGSAGLKKLFGNMGSVLSAAMGVLVCYTLMFIISTAVVMSMNGV